MSSPRIEVLDLPLDLLTFPSLLERVEGFITRAERRTVGYLNMHVMDQSRANPRLASFIHALDICYCDGQGVRLAARIQGHRFDPELRYTGADWIWDFAAWAEGRHPVFWLGGRPGVTEKASVRLRERHPGLQIDHDHGFHPKEGAGNGALIERINAARPDVLLVGMGTPIQEEWVLLNRARLEVPVVWCLGATADFVSGAVPRGPALLQRQEWLARLTVEPRRLWRRYLLGNWRVVGRAAARRLTGPKAG